MSEELRELLQRETSKNFIKAAFKEAVREWLDDIFSTFGRWSMTSLAAMAVAGIGYFILWANGWHK